VVNFLGQLEHLGRLSRSKALRCTEKEGLSNNTVYGILEDDNGHLSSSLLRAIIY